MSNCYKNNHENNHEDKCVKSCCECLVFKCYLKYDFTDACSRYIKISNQITKQPMPKSSHISSNKVSETTSTLIIPPYTSKGYIGKLYLPIANIKNNHVYYSFNKSNGFIEKGGETTLFNKADPIYDCINFNYVNDYPFRLKNKCEYCLVIDNAPIL